MIRCIWCKAELLSEKHENAKILIRPSKKLYYDEDERGIAYSLCDTCYKNLKRKLVEAEKESEEE